MVDNSLFRINLDGGFFAIYTDQGPLTVEGDAAALAFARKRSNEIDAALAKYPTRITPARRASDAVTIAAKGRLIAYKSIENSYPLGENLSLLSEFYDAGVRIAGPIHGANNQFGDSATDTPKWNGLSPLGRAWVKEMNRLGIVIDASHASDASFDQMLALSRAPIILTHSGSRAMFDHPRNLNDARIRALAARGGAICFSSIYLSKMNLSPERARLFGAYERINSLSASEQAKLTADWRALDKTERMWSADFDDYMRALLHTIKVAGVGHVCFGADWDGGGGLVGLEDITAHPKITARLLAAGYTQADLAKMWSGNVLRILKAAERGRAR